MFSKATALLVGAISLAVVAPMGAQAAPDLTDPEVAHVAVTANSIDIDAGKFAQTKTQNADVRQFAAMMVSSHTGVNTQAADLAKRLNVTPKDNAVSQSLVSGATAAHTTLASLNGAAFDRAYMQREVDYHQAVLDALDKVLIPTTENADLKALLVSVRPAIASHLQHAKTILAALK